MNIAVRTLLRSGAGSSIIEDFRVLAETTSPNGEPRYRERPLLEDLARFIARGGGGPNRDAPFYELCHLVNAVDAAGTGRDRRNAFFLEPEAATSARFQVRLDRALARGGWRRAGFHRAKEGIAIQYLDGAFTIRFSRMPFLAALYEFLAGMEDFSFYGELAAVFDDMTARPADVKQVQAASNRIASHFRQYRRRHLTNAQHDGKFDALFGFVAARSPEGSLVVDDAGVLDFWTQKSLAGDFRAYRTVFDAFATFLRALDETSRGEAMVQAAPIGINRDQGEVEPDDSAETAGAEEWTSPLAILDEEPASAIKFLKKEGERKPMEALMNYGPTAIRLPLAFLRLESFGPVQSAITTDLQLGRESVDERISCAEAAGYGGIVTRFANLVTLLQRLQKAAFYALHKGKQERHPDIGNVVPLSAATLFDQARSMSDQGGETLDGAALERLAADAGKTFRAIARKGFDEADLGDEARVRGFEIGAGALVAAARHLASYLAATRRIPGPSLEQWFDADRATFSERFRVLYGVRQ
ncbi:MAG: hypothetical protein AB7E79_06960 [Rhodospirillaceae bacterium]